MNRKVKSRGFTLIEVLLVVLILSVLATLVIPRIAESSQDAKIAKCDTNVSALNRSIELYALRNGSYPTNQTEFENNILNDTDYFPHGSPVCPFETTYTYNAVTKTVAFHNH
ncbi:prepilin-type N-terminal cleavage/methylation domain-containing protein [Planctomycetota bacterium]